MFSRSCFIPCPCLNNSHLRIFPHLEHSSFISLPHISIFFSLPKLTTTLWFRNVCTMFAITVEANPCEVIMFFAILTTFFVHKLPRFRKIQRADLNGINLPTRNTGTLRGKMQLLAICQIETTGIEPVSHDIGYHCSTTELCFISPPVTDSSFQMNWDGFHFCFIQQ